MADDRAYRIIVGFDAEHERFTARVPELGLEVVAKTRNDAVTEAEQAIDGAVEKAATSKKPLPAPADSRDVPEALEVKLAAPLFRELVFHAEQSKMSVQSFATQLLSRGIGGLEGLARPSPAAATPPAKDTRETSDEGREHREGRDNRGRGRGRGRGRKEGYRPDLDDKANFLEYLRGLDKGRGGR